MNTKKKIIVSILLILLLVAPIVFYYTSRKRPQYTQLDSGESIPIPVIPDNSQLQQYKIKLNVKEESLNVPEKIKLITYEAEALSESDIENVAHKLPFADEPQISNDYHNGKNVLYKNNKAYLSSFTEIGQIMYSLHTFPTISPDNKIDNQQAIQNAVEFLQSTNITNTQENVVANIIYYKISTTETYLIPTDSENAEIIQVNFTPNISEYPILTLDPKQTLTYVLVSINGEIYRAGTTRLKSIETSQEVKLRNYEEIQNTLNEAVIVSVKSGEIYVSTIAENSIRSIEINNLRLAYLQTSQKTNTIQPVFLLNGTVNIDSLKETVPITLYLPATSKN